MALYKYINFDETIFYKVPYLNVRHLVQKGNVLLKRGIVFLPSTKMLHVASQAFGDLLASEREVIILNNKQNTQWFFKEDKLDFFFKLFLLLFNFYWYNYCQFSAISLRGERWFQTGANFKKVLHCFTKCIALRAEFHRFKKSGRSNYIHVFIIFRYPLLSLFSHLFLFSIFL